MPLPQENAMSIRELRERCDRLERAVMVLVEIVEASKDVLGYTSRIEKALSRDEDYDGGISSW